MFMSCENVCVNKAFPFNTNCYSNSYRLCRHRSTLLICVDCHVYVLCVIENCYTGFCLLR